MTPEDIAHTIARIDEIVLQSTMTPYPGLSLEYRLGCADTMRVMMFRQHLPDGVAEGLVKTSLPPWRAAVQYRCPTCQSALDTAVNLAEMVLRACEGIAADPSCCDISSASPERMATRILDVLQPTTP